MSNKLTRYIHRDNISTMYATTAVIMIFSALTGVIAVLIDGIISSRFIGSDVYSGIALIRPFSSVVLMLASFVSTGCNLVCSNLVGIGERDKANEAFNLSSLLAVLFAVVLILGVMIFPETMLRMCGVVGNRYPELSPHMYGYLHGYVIGLPALMLIQVFGPIFVMDNGKRLFSVSSAVLCIVDIVGDLLNAFVFHGGAFGMGVATSMGYILQLLVLFVHFVRPNCYFKLLPGRISFSYLKDIAHYGSPAFVKRIAGTLKDILLNYINLMAAVTTAAIAARGIQSDFFQFLFCIATGLGQTMATMSGTLYSVNDLRGLKRLFVYGIRFGVTITGISAAFVFVAARPLTQIYTDDPEIISLAVFSIRFMAIGLVFDTVSAQVQHYLQGIRNLKMLNVLCIGDRFVIPVATAFVLGRLYGSKGVLASVGISKFILVFVLLIYIMIRCKGLPKSWTDVMFLPEGFGGSEEDNLYAEIRTLEDAIRQSKRSYDFCLEHGADKQKAFYLSLCVEEMAVNIIENAKEEERETARADFRLFVNEGRICFSLRDLTHQFDPTAFYNLHHDDNPEAHIGIRMVTMMAEEVRYFSAFNSNNLIIYID